MTTQQPDTDTPPEVAMLQRLQVTVEERLGASSPVHDMLHLVLPEAVRLRVFALLERGGPTVDDFRGLERRFSEILGSEALFTTKKNHTSARQFNALAQVLAILSFLPGGVTFFGIHYETPPVFLTDCQPQQAPTSRGERRLTQARVEAEEVAQAVIANWKEERPLTGYSEITRAIREALRDHYADLGIEVRSAITVEVGRAVFEALLPDYERRYGTQLVRASWAAIRGEPGHKEQQERGRRRRPAQ